MSDPYSRTSHPDTLTLRPLSVNDAEAMVAVLGDASLYRYTGGQPPALEELSQRYARQARGASPDGTQQWINLLVVLDGMPIGYVQATVTDEGRSAEVAWVIGAAWQGRGYAKRAVRMLLGQLGEEQGVHEVVAHIHPEHLASQAVARSVGLSGTATVVDGEVCWRLPLCDGGLSPA